MKDSKEFAREHSYKIPMLDASVIWRLNDSGGGLKLYERVKNSKGNEKYKPNTVLFGGALKYCLETEKLESVYKEAFRVKSFCSVHNDNRYSDALISVSFDSTYKEYNLFGKVEGYHGEGKLYVKAGYHYENGRVIDSISNEYEITDNYAIKNGARAYSEKSYLMGTSAGNCEWWTRSPGDKSSKVFCVSERGGMFYVTNEYLGGNYVNNNETGVRPAMWVDLSDTD